MIAATTQHWQQAGVTEVADADDEEGLPGGAISRARLWCKTVACTHSRTCEHTCMVRLAFGYSDFPEMTGEQHVALTVDPRTR